MNKTYLTFLFIQLIRFFSLIIILFYVNSSLHSQSFELNILFLDIDVNQIEQQIEEPAKSFSDSLSLLHSLSHFVNELIRHGYHEASLDTLILKEEKYFGLMHLGPNYQWKTLTAKSTPKEWLAKAGFRNRLYQEKTLNINEWQQLQKDLARQAANNGYPFARILLDSISWEEAGKVKADIVTQKGPLVFFEELIIEGELDISTQYMEQYLGFVPGQPYNQSVILNAQQRLQELAFVQTKDAPKVQFIGNQAKLILHLEPKRASRFDFIVGVLPNNKQTGRILITGQLEAALQNAFGKGETIAVSFEQPRAQTQSLELAFQYPYIFELPFGFDSQFNLYKRDTNYLDLNWRLGVQYLLQGDNNIQAFWSNQQTNVLNIDTNQLIQQQRLPDTLDVKRQAFGLGFVFRKLDYRHNPKKGWDSSLRISAGQKQISRNTQIEDLGFTELYDNIQLRSAQYRINLSLAKYQSFSERSVLKLAVEGAAILGKEAILANEQFRIGGNRLLRGFDEESLFASKFALISTEYRFILSTHSYFYAFYDLARVDNKALGSPSDTTYIDWPQGIGAGITFETRSGLFGLSLAFGKQNQQAYNFGAPKVHFGYVSLF